MLRLNIQLKNSPIAAFLIMLGGIFAGTLIAFSLMFAAAKIYAPFGEIFFHQAPATAEYMRWMFLLSTPITFILPAVWVAKTYRPGEAASFLKLNQVTTPQIVFLAILALLFCQGFISMLGDWNKQLVLPESLSGIENWMKSSEENAIQTTNLVMQSHSYAILMVNILLMAFIPGFCEELLFRGVIQNLLIDSMKRKHLAIWVTAFVFAFIHFEFYTFLPRLGLGLLLGYLVVWTGSLWPSIIIHMLNNAMVVVFTFSTYNKAISPSVEKSMENIDPIYGFLSLIATGGILLILKLFADKKVTD